MAGRGDEALLRVDVPAIHVLLLHYQKDVDARDKPGHDERDRSCGYGSRAGAQLRTRQGRRGFNPPRTLPPAPGLRACASPRASSG
ncbi:MAG: hypothetical protein E6G82_05615 [Alphaproteobacteria bacterium]|nr:MAG: hypothetical protein E6G82_05615 [Alphaproteobacteria bacterium]